MHQASAQYRPRGYPAYQQGYGYPDNNPAYNAAKMRVTSISDVRRNSRGLRVSGEINSGMQQPYGNAYGYRNQVSSDLNFRCNVAYNERVTDVRVRPHSRYVR